MKSKKPDNRQFLALLERWCEGEHEESLAAEISALLRDNPDLVWEYLCYMEMHATLRYQEREEDGMGPGIPTAGKNGQTTAHSAPRLFVANSQTDGGSFFGPAGKARWPILAAACAGLVGLVVTALFLVASRWNLRERVAVGGAEKKGPVVARLVSAFHCDWEGTISKRQVGDALRQDETVALAAGFARIAFETGAIMTLQAPARVVLSDPNGVLLLEGTVTSEVPEQARGFTVETASSRIVDFGTEFGVAVDEAGSTALSVFRGMVEIAGRRRDALPARRVTAGQAIRFDHVGEMVEWRKVDPSRFAPGCCNEAGEPDPDALPVHVRRFRHARDLSFPNRVIAAINVGSSEPLEVAGTRFAGDRGKHIASPCEARQWGTQPWFGDSPDDAALARLLYSIRHNLTRSAKEQDQPGLAEPVQVALPVEKGRYRVSLLLCENHHARAPTRDRSLNVDVEGRCCVRDLRILAVQGIAGYPVPPNQAIVLSTEIDVADGTLDVLLFSRYVAEDVDENVILNGLVVEHLD